MSKKSYPDSLELLLDTICNTFGSIILIAISLVVFVLISKNTVHHESWDEEMVGSLESDIKAIENEKQEIVKLIKTITTQDCTELDANDYKQAQNRLILLESENQNIAYSNSVQDIKNAELSSELDKIFLDNNSKENDLLSLIDDRNQDLRDLENKKNQIEIAIDSLKDELDKIPRKNIHFANNERTSKDPFWVIIESNKLHRLGEFSEEGTPEVRVNSIGDISYLYPQNGVSILGDLSTQDVSSLFSRANKNRYFLFFIVNPDSLESFIRIRRHLRSLNYQVNWGIQTSYKLYSTFNPVFNASF